MDSCFKVNIRNFLENSVLLNITKMLDIFVERAKIFVFERV